MLDLLNYQGAVIIILKILFLHFSIFSMCDADTAPCNCTQQYSMGFRGLFYSQRLQSSFKYVLLLISQCISYCFHLICANMTSITTLMRIKVMTCYFICNHCDYFYPCIGIRNFLVPTNLRYGNEDINLTTPPFVTKSIVRQILAMLSFSSKDFVIVFTNFTYQLWCIISSHPIN